MKTDTKTNTKTKTKTLGQNQFLSQLQLLVDKSGRTFSRAPKSQRGNPRLKCNYKYEETRRNGGGGSCNACKQKNMQATEKCKLEVKISGGCKAKRGP